jgi:endonuclease/exonuclease/phosphatase (EEP) superfamily protein YafD
MLADRRGRMWLLGILIVFAVVAGGWWVYQRARERGGPTASSFPGATAAATHPQGRVRIATWNLRKFSDRVDHPPDLVTIARIIQENSFDLLAIQEVQQQGQIVQKLRRQLNEPWRVEITAQTGNHERYAFLYRSDRVELIEGPRLAEGPDAAVFDRRPANATFKSGNFDFMLLTAHLWYGEKANNAKRRAEAEALVRIAAGIAQRGAEKDLIVLGDFNEMHNGAGNLHLFEEQGWIRLNREATNLGSSEAFDNMLIDPRFTREFAGSVGVVRFDELLYGNDDKRAMEDVSDHRPLWADFSTAGPDDD